MSVRASLCAALLCAIAAAVIAPLAPASMASSATATQSLSVTVAPALGWETPSACPGPGDATPAGCVISSRRWSLVAIDGSRVRTIVARAPRTTRPAAARGSTAAGSARVARPVTLVASN